MVPTSALLASGGLVRLHVNREAAAFLVEYGRGAPEAIRGMPGRGCVSRADRSSGLVADPLEQDTVGAQTRGFCLEPIDHDVGLGLRADHERTLARGIEQRDFDIFIGRRMQVDLHLVRRDGWSCWSHHDVRGCAAGKNGKKEGSGKRGNF
jgi:hypothetical protein